VHYSNIFFAQLHCAKKLSQHIEFRKYCLFHNEKRYLHKRKRPNTILIIVVYLTSLCVNWPKKAQFTHERDEYNVFLFDEPLKGFKSLKTFKISLTFRFDKLSHLSKSAHIGENSQILTVSNKKLINYFCYF
jgi:hypothetical protein